MGFFAQNALGYGDANGGTPVQLADGAQLDAFNRLRVSNPFTQLDVSQIGDDRPDLMDTLLVGTGARAYQIAESASDLTVTAASDKAVFQSKRYGFYQPGKSLLIEMTGVLIVTDNGGTHSKIGYFDDVADKTDGNGNGFFFYNENGAVGVTKRSSSSGAQVDTQVLQANWNIDPMNGAGMSGKTFDPTKTNMFVIDGQWLGVGRVRMGLVIGGILYYVHEFLHANIETESYTESFNLPLRWEIESTTTAGTLKAICGSIQSEGGFEPRGVATSATSGVAGILVNGADISLVAVRSRTGYNRVSVNPLQVPVVTNSNNPVEIRIYLADTVTGGAWANAGTSSESNSTFTAFSGRHIATAYASSQSRQAAIDLRDLIFTGSDIPGVQQSIVITGTDLAGNVTTWAGLNFQEVR